MPRGNHLGELELIVLAALLRLADNAYGVTVRKEIEVQTGRNVSIGSVYKTLDRLGQKGFVTARMGDSTPVRGGRAKQYFHVTAAGLQAVTASIRSVRQMFDGLDLDTGLA